ncbi:hypothetical protein C5Y96_05475 [Blastopirellula marina]|uniref:Immunity MXAN-0049 protein domain-containing protein n=1 Tax=Blastopirellula marina TaxID=124 RepID=A0A2S8G4C6_9BACT|nr:MULTISPECIES: DUF1629 domain-containing protein [Pirellulaceae]PQO39306.1 hypothetical protein C5Y96_05475 [Blastopirellula marina]RCS55614.1 hypothetical protein DTL36_05485 [Bremerella cremea]
MLYKLEDDVDTYGGFFWEDKSNYMATISSEPLGAKWKPPAIVGQNGLPKKMLKLGPPDFASVSPGMYLLKPQVYEALQPLWHAAGETFQAETSRGPYLLFHVTREIDCLDHTQCKFAYADEEQTRIGYVKQYKFHDEAIQGSNLFRIPETYKLESFASQQVKDIVQAAGFTGFFFEKIRWSE